jgi:hypothetical protein
VPRFKIRGDVSPFNKGAVLKQGNIVACFIILVCDPFLLNGNEKIVLLLQAEYTDDMKRFYPSKRITEC